MVELRRDDERCHCCCCFKLNRENLGGTNSDALSSPAKVANSLTQTMQ